MSSTVLDASALLALLNQEQGAEQVAEAISAGVVMSAVNLSETVAKLAGLGMPADLIHSTLDPLGIELVDFDSQHAYQTALLYPLTRQAGLSLGDRACLALAQRLGIPALTADRTWQTLGLDVAIRVIR